MYRKEAVLYVTTLAGMRILQRDACFGSSSPIRVVRQVAPRKLAFPMESNAGRGRRLKAAREGACLPERVFIGFRLKTALQESPEPRQCRWNRTLARTA